MTKKNKYTSIKKHKNHSKVLKPPMNTLPGGTNFSSWVNDRMPQMLWACILAGNLERKDYLELFRSVALNLRSKIDNYEKLGVTHSDIAKLSDSEFDLVFKQVIDNKQATETLSCLLLLDFLPDINHWKRSLANLKTPSNINSMVSGVLKCFDHQSQNATDVRWLKVIYLVIIGKLKFPESMKDEIEELRLYPNYGDMRKVRPSIRAMEISISGGKGPFNTEPSYQEFCDKFWDKMLENTDCDIIQSFKVPSMPIETIRTETFDLLKSVSDHFDNTLATTKIDARHDVSFGLVLYALGLLFELTLSYSHKMAGGRIILRTIMEAYVTLHYLTKKDNPSEWLTFREDGAGKTKLAFLKNLDGDEKPEFIDVERLENLANEEMWMEFRDMNIGTWSNKNLRKIAEESGIKQVYDKYYDWASGYAHSQWVCIRDAAFSICANPLHRFHKIPVPTKSNMPSVLPDSCKLINMMLDDLNSLYPAFKPRLRSYKLKDVVKKDESEELDKVV